jgi:hypothetical protein
MGNGTRSGGLIAAVGGIALALSQTSLPSQVVNLVHHHENAKDELGVVVRSLDTALQDAHLGRSALFKVTKKVDGCTITPAGAVTSITSIENSNRRQVLREDIQGVNAPSNNDARELLRDFTHAMDTSYQADDRYRVWLREWNRQDPTASPGNCVHPPHDQAWSDFVTLSDSATVLKKQFAKAYNPYAKEHGLRHNWSRWSF